MSKKIKIFLSSRCTDEVIVGPNTLSYFMDDQDLENYEYNKDKPPFVSLLQLRLASKQYLENDIEILNSSDLLEVGFMRSLLLVQSVQTLLMYVLER